MNIQTIVNQSFHGLPGIGVSGQTGPQGKKGKSIYVGYLRSFFDGKYLTEEQYVYIRVKNQDNGSKRTEYEYYYRNDENFYRHIKGVDATMDQMVKFTIKNLKAVYYENLPVNTIKTETWKSLDTSSEKFLNRKDIEKIEDGLEYVYGTPSADNIEGISFNVEIDEKYLEDRRFNNSKSNYSNSLSPDVFIPSKLKDIYNEGDILYIQDDVTGDIICFIEIQEGMEGMSFEEFLKLKFVSIESLTSNLRSENGRGQIFKKVSFPVMQINKKIKEINDKGIFQKNFISHHKNNYNLHVIYNDLDDCQFMEFLVGDKKFDVDYALTTNKISNRKDNIVFKTTKLDFENLYLKNIDTNINIPEYNNENALLVDGLHSYSIDTSMIKIEKEKIIFDVPSSISLQDRKDCVFGLNVYILNDGMFELYKSFETLNSNINFEIESVDLEDETDFQIVTYIKGLGMTAYYSQITSLKILCGIENDEYVITDYKIQKNDDNSFSSKYDDEFFRISTNEITCEKKDDFAFEIETLDKDVEISDVYINNSQLVINGLSVSNPSIKGWISFDNDSFMNLEFDEDRLSKINIGGLKVDSNIPTLPGIDGEYDYISDYFKTISSYSNLFQIGSQKLNKTIDREMILTVFGINKSTGQKVKQRKKISQSGVFDFMKDVSVSFTDSLKDNQIEEFNSPDSSVLCNQFRYKLNGHLHGFNKENWSQFLKNPKMTVYLNLDHETETSLNDQFYFSDTNINNIQIYSIDESKMIRNNGIRVKFKFNGKEIDFENDTEVYTTGTKKPVSIFDDWVVLNPVDLKRPNSALPRGINFDLNKNYQSFIENLGFDDSFEIEVLSEIANPIPMEFNFKWRVDKILIYGPLVDEYAKDESVFIFEKDLRDANTYSKLGNISLNTKFIVNPVSLTLDYEKNEMQPIRGSVKKVGSESPIRLKAELEKIGSSVLDEYYNESYDVLINRQEMYKHYSIEIPNIEYYIPKVKYFQDNITNIAIKPKKLQIGMNEKLTEIFNLYNKKTDYWKNNFNLYFEVSDLDNGYQDNLISLSYDSKMMLPNKRNGVETFYFNDKLYESEYFNQWSENAPLWTSFVCEQEIIEQSIVDAKQVWNFEYEVSKNYNSDKVTGGVLSKSGNGYLYLENTIDEGQYDNEGTMNLETLKSEVEKYIEFDSSIDMTVPSGFKSQPKPKEFFSALLKRIDWNYPNFINMNGSQNVFPYHFCNSMMSDIDNIVMKELNSTENWDSTEILVRNMFENYDSCKQYLDMKVEKEIYLNSESKESGLTKINMLIPYNLVFDIFPRTCYNIDMGENTVNVLMLQQPSLIEKYNYKYNKSCFEDEDFVNSYVPWNFNI